MKYKHLHIIIDHIYTKQFYEYVQLEFDDHLFILVDLEHGEKNKFFDGINKNIIRFSKSEFKTATINSEIYWEISKIENIYIHYLYNFYCDFFVNLPFEKNNLYWIVWGADLYDYIPYEIYDINTKNEFSSSVNKTLYSESFIKNRAMLISKLSGICTAFTLEYNLIKQFYSTKSPKIELRYNISFYLDNIKNLIEENKYDKKRIRVLVGNSGDISNNHETVFNHLAKFLPHDARVIVPLNYGNLTHIKQIKLIGEKILESKIIPLEDYLEFNDYVQILNSVDCIIMNHKRQQAVGNILIALYLGKPIFLSEKSPVFYDLIEKGFLIQRTEILSNIGLNDFIDLCSLDYDINREKFNNYFSEEYLKDFYINFFNKL